MENTTETRTNLVQSTADAVTKKATAVQREATQRGREVWLAGLGAAATVTDEAQRFVSGVLGRAQQAQNEAFGTYRTLVERGEEREAEGKRQIAAVGDALTERQEALSAKLGELSQSTGKPADVARAQATSVETTVRRSMDTVLERLDAPSRTEIRELTGKIDTLATKVNALASLLDEEAEVAQAEAEAAELPEGQAPDVQADDVPRADVPTLVLHVVTADDGWAVKEEGGETKQTFSTKAEALDGARAIAKAQLPSRLVVHRKDGTIQDSTSYDA